MKNFSKGIRTAFAYSPISQAEAARRLNMSSQNFSGKIRKESYSYDEMQRYAEMMGCEFEAHFVFPDGTKI